MWRQAARSTASSSAVLAPCPPEDEGSMGKQAEWTRGGVGAVGDSTTEQLKIRNQKREEKRGGEEVGADWGSTKGKAGIWGGGAHCGLQPNHGPGPETASWGALRRRAGSRAASQPPRAGRGRADHEHGARAHFDALKRVMQRVTGDGVRNR